MGGVPTQAFLAKGHQTVLGAELTGVDGLHLPAYVGGHEVHPPIVVPTGRHATVQVAEAVHEEVFHEFGG